MGAFPFEISNPGIGFEGDFTSAEAAVLQQFASLGDPNDDRIVFWDDSAGEYAYLDLGDGLAISTTTMSVDINSLTEEAGFTTGDFVMFYDTTAGALRKVNYSNLPGATGGAQISGTPVDNQIAVWTNATTIEGTSDFTFDGSDLVFYDATNDGNPEIRLGSADANEAHIQTVYDSAAQTLDYLLISTDSATEGDIILSPAGNAGVGLTAPYSKLQVQGDGITASNTGGAAVLRSDRTDGKIAALIAGLSGTGFYFDSTGTFDVVPTSRATLEGTSFTGTPILRLEGSNSRVGINNTSPQSRLDIVDTTGAQARLSYTVSTVYTTLTTGSGGDFTIAPTGGDVNITGNLNISAPGNATGDALTTDDTQTLTNKTIDANSNTLSNIALGAEATGALGDLSNVTEATPANDEILQYVTDHWENQTLAEAGIQPLDAELTAIAGLTSAADRGIYFTGSGTASLFTLTSAARTILDDASTAAIRTTLGVGTGDSPQLTAVNIGHATDTTVARLSAGDITVEGNLLYRAGGTDVPVADGGTGRSSHTAYAVLCGGTTTTGAQQSIASVGTTGQVLTSNGAGALPTFQDAAGGSLDVQTFTSSGTWTKPSSGTKVLVQAWGGGGGGGGGNGVGGGGGGGYSEAWFAIGDLGATVTVTVGAGGAAQASQAVGNVGGNTTFGSHLTAYGGAGGGGSSTTSSGGGGGGNSSAGSAGAGGGNGGAGGTVLGGAGGTRSGTPTAGGASSFGGGGGGGASSTAGVSGAVGGESVKGGGGGGGGAPNSASAQGGTGGASMYGGAGGAGGGYLAGTGGTSIFGGAGGTGASSNSSTASTAGSQPGGGGGGGAFGIDTGAAGGAGQVIVTTF